MINHTNISQKAYEALFELIVSRKLPPGRRLVEDQLAKDLGVSRTPLREAISRLAADGLVALEPRKGASVRVFEINDVIEVYDIRMALEGLAARLAAPHLDRRTLEKLKEQFESGDMKTLIKADTELHRLMTQHCGNRRLSEILNNLYNLIQAFRVAGYGSPRRSTQATADHRKIVQALLKRDGDKAEQLVRDHVERTQREIRKEFEQKNSKDSET